MGCGGSKKQTTGKISPLKVSAGVTVKECKIVEAKIVLLGGTGVGKSSIAMRFSQDKFPDAHDVTIGGAYFQQQITLANGTSVKMHIWDTGGAERFRSMAHIYYKDAVAAILTYDITSSKSLDAVKYWLEDLGLHADPKRMVLALAANKCDMTPENKFVVPLGKKFAEDNGLIFKETSALNGTGIKDIFRLIVETIVAKGLC